MTTIALLSLAFVTLVIYNNFLRSQRTFSYNLLPNRLLTRHPLLFISGKKSIFYFLNYWNSVPDLLREHGYEVYELDLPWRHNQRRQERLIRFLNSEGRQGRLYHLVADASCENDLYAALRCQPIAVRSCWLVCDSSGPLRPQDLAPLSGGVQRLNIPGEKSKSGFGIIGLLLTLHNLYLAHTARLSPAVVAYPGACDLQNTARVYLDLALRLAEQDLQEI